MLYFRSSLLHPQQVSIMINNPTYLLRPALFGLSFAFACAGLSAQTYTWTNLAMDGRAWANGDNWSTDAVDPPTDWPDAVGAVANFQNFTFTGLGPERVAYSGETVGVLNIDLAASQTLRFGRGGTSATLNLSAVSPDLASFNFTGAGELRVERRLNFASSGVVSIAHSDALLLVREHGQIAGAGDITIQGNGTLLLDSSGIGGSGNRTVEGNIRLIVDDSLSGTGVLTMRGSSILSGTGSIATSTVIQLGATLAPGSSPGILTFSNDLSLEAMSAVDFTLVTNSSADRGINFSGVDTTGGTLSIADGAIINLNFATGNVDFTGSFWQENQNWLIFNNAESPVTESGIFTLGTVSLDSLGQEFSITGGTLSFEQINNDIHMLYIIPEPHSIAAALGIFALLAVVVGRRSRGRLMS